MFSLRGKSFFFYFPFWHWVSFYSSPRVFGAKKLVKLICVTRLNSINRFSLLYVFRSYVSSCKVPSFLNMVHLKAFKITALCTATQLILMALAICKRRNCVPVKIFTYVTIHFYKSKQRLYTPFQKVTNVGWDSMSIFRLRTTEKISYHYHNKMR